LIANDFGAILTSRPDASRRPQGGHALGQRPEPSCASTGAFHPSPCRAVAVACLDPAGTSAASTIARPAT